LRPPFLLFLSYLKLQRSGYVCSLSRLPGTLTSCICTQGDSFICRLSATQVIWLHPSLNLHTLICNELS
ncbi:TPA: hypothetical protein ACGUW3_004082, partial [Vibrio vulnificus]